MRERQEGLIDVVDGVAPKGQRSDADQKRG